MNKVVVATDFSERSDRAIRRAVLLAKSHGAALSLVHVIDDDQPNRIIRAEQKAAEAVLAEQTRALRDIDGLACDSRIVLGDPFDGIVRAAREDEADILIIGPHRRQMLKDVFVGTTAERTIRAIARPVLMASGIPAGPYRHVLVAVDLSDCSGDAVQAVQDLGLEAQAAVSVVHVYDAPASGLMRRAASTMEQIKGYLAEEEERASGELAEFLKDFDLAPMHRILKPDESSVAQTICTTAREVSADLVVVGTHGRSGVARVLLGSVAGEMLQISERDILAVPPRP